MYILDNGFLSGAFFGKKYYPFCGLSSNSLDIDFHWAKAFKFNEIQLIFFFFMDLAFGGVVKRPYDSQGNLGFLIYSLHGVLYCSFSHVGELFFVKGTRFVSRPMFLQMIAQFFSIIFCRDYLYCITFSPLSKISWLYLWRSISGISVLAHYSICLFFCQCHTALITIAE